MRQGRKAKGLKSLKKYYFVALFVVVVMLVMTEATQATLYDRCSGLLYDDELDITWLQDANYAKTSGYDADGSMNFSDAVTWAEQLVYHDNMRNVNYDDWRLPKNLGDDLPFHFGWWFATGDDTPTVGPHSELSYMYYMNLDLNGYFNTWGAWQDDFGIFGDGTNSGQNDVGLVMNLQAGAYWLDYKWSGAPVYYWVFTTNTGNHRTNGSTIYSWAVRDGDVGPAPVLVENTQMSYPESIQSVYNDPNKIISGDTILLLEQTYDEHLILNRDILVEILGGYDCNYNEPSVSFSTIKSMTINKGTVYINKIIIRSQPPPIECINDLTLCTTSDDCTTAGGYWWSDNTCMGVPESDTVVSAGGRIWIDHNLGASRVAMSSTDTLAYGDHYQWGRGADGHQLRASATTMTLSSIDDPGHSDFILTDGFPDDWRDPQNNNLWQGVSGTNNPCPAGFRIPTDAEWLTEMTSWSSQDPAGAFASPLKLVLGGYRCHYCGQYYDEGSHGYYWSSNIYGVKATYLLLKDGSAEISAYDRAYGYNVRCIMD